MMLMWSTIAGPVYNPKTSKVADNGRRGDHAGRGHAPRQDRPRRLGHGHPEEREEQGRRVDAAHVPHLEGMGQVYEVGAHQTDPARNSVFNDPALNKKFPYLKTAGQANAEGADPRDREHPGDVRADHDRGAAVRRGAQRLVDSAADGLQEGQRRMGQGPQAWRPPQVASRAGAVTEPFAADADRPGDRSPRLAHSGGGARGCSCSGRARVYLVVFSIYPLVASLARSFRTTTRRKDTWRWIGLRNYSELFTSSEFWTVVENTLILTTAGVAIQVIVGHRARALLQPEPARRARSCAGS